MTMAICKFSSSTASSVGRGKRIISILVSLLLLFLAAALLTGCKKGSAEWKKGVASLKEEEYEDAAEHFKESAAKGNDDARMMLALCYAIGMGVDQDSEEAEKLIGKAAKNDHPVAQAAYGLLLFKEGSKRDPDKKDKAIKYLKKSADQDCVFGELALAFYYLDGADENDDNTRKKALSYLKKAAGHPVEKKTIFADDVVESILIFLADHSDFVESERDAKFGLKVIAALYSDLKDWKGYSLTDMCIVGSQLALGVIYSGIVPEFEKDSSESEKWMNKAKENGVPKTVFVSLEMLQENLSRASSSSYRESPSASRDYPEYDGGSFRGLQEMNKDDAFDIDF